MAITPLRAEPYWQNPVNQTADGTTYTARYLVKFNGISSATKKDYQTICSKAINAEGIPRYGSSWITNKNAYCEAITAEEFQSDNHPTQVIVTCTFSTIPVSDRDQEDNPLAKRPDIDWGVMFERQVIENVKRLRVIQNGQQLQVVNGAAAGGAAAAINGLNDPNLFDLGITNSALDPFQPQPEKDVPYLTCTITRNIESSRWNPKEAARSVGSINIDPLTIDGEKFNAKEVMVLDRGAGIRYAGKQSYREERIQLLFKSTHDLIIQDRGFQGYETGDKFGGRILPPGAPGANVDPKKVFKVDGQDAPIEQLMDGKGNRLEAGQNTVYLYFEYAPDYNFNQIGLPTQKL